MSASTRVSSSVLALLALGCVEQEPLPSRTTSLKVNVTAPADVGSEVAPLPDGTRQVTVSVQALDELGHVDGDFAAPVDVYVHTLGGLSDVGVKLDMSGGQGTMTVPLPTVFGATYLWFEDVLADATRRPTYATGTSTTLWFREPFVVDVSTPAAGLSAGDKLRRSPLELKQVRVATSRHGASGRLLVTSVFTDGYGVSDVDCSTTPCTADPFGHVYVFSFSRAVDVKGRAVQVGQTLKWFSGGVAEFNGFTELNFPSQEIADTTTRDELLPQPVAIQKEWLRGSENQLEMEKNEAGLMAVVNARVCPLDDDFDRYKQWKVDVGLGCGTPVNVISASTVAGFSPADNVGKVVPRIAGMLKTVNLGSFNVWILQPRRPADITN